MPSEMLRDLFAKREAAFSDYEYVAAVYRSTDSPPEDFTSAYTDHKGRVEALDSRILEVEADEHRNHEIAEARQRAGIDKVAPVIVTEEQRTYGEGSPYSYYADLCSSAMPGTQQYQDAVERLSVHGREMVRDAVNDPAMRSRLIKLGREHYRNDPTKARHFAEDIRSRSLEVRAGMDTGSGSGGSFVTPQYLVSEWAAYRQFGRVFVNQANVMALPDYGMTVFLPAVQGASSVATQSSQNSGIAETDPTAGYLSAPLVTTAGQVTVSQQLLDRAGPGVEFDRITFDSLQRAYNFSFNAAVMTAALANAGSVPDTHTTATAAAVVQDLYSDVATAIQNIETAAGTVLYPTHLFATPTEWAFVSSLLDANGRPLVVPGYAGPFNAVAAALNGKENAVAEGDTGFEVQSLPVFKDGGIPASGSNTQVVVAHMPEVWVWEGELVPRTVPQTYANTLSVLLQVYSYNATIVRYPKAVQAISGARYPVSPTFIYA